MTIHVVLGLGFGDEGKGTIVDWLARRLPAPALVVRYNGGPQAQHHVVTDDGRTHCFAQLGSASFVDGGRTHLAHDMAIDPYALHAEAAAFGDPDVLSRVTVDPRCVVVTPWHAILNRVRESRRGDARHGSTGRGIGEAKLGPHKLVVADLAANVERHLRAHRDAVLADATVLDANNALIEDGRDPELFETFLEATRRPLSLTTEVPRADSIIFESAQGAMLDRDHGWFPHVTPSRITRRAAEVAARELGCGDSLEVWGVLRAYYTRHGEGPFPTEDAQLTGLLPELHNREDGPAGRFRVGWFDAELARRAIGFAGPIDRLAITCLDRVDHLAKRAIVVDGQVRETTDIARAIETAVARKIDVESWGPRAGDKRVRVLGPKL